MCHSVVKFHTKYPEAFNTMISSGNAHIGMPAFGEYLTEKQIHSLIQFLSKIEDLQ
jgi:mono/diheme cytochrome c family protein